MHTSNRRLHPHISVRPREGMISLVIAVRNEAGALPELHERLSRVLDEFGLEWEIILVEDSSTDQTVEVIRELGERDERLKSIFLTRGFGHHLAITAGLDHAQGDHIILMDGDLQHRPEDIPKLLAPYFEGFDIVYGRKTGRQPLVKELGSRCINALANWLSDFPIDLNSGMFRVFSKKVNNTMRFGFLAYLGYTIGPGVLEMFS